MKNCYECNKLLIPLAYKQLGEDKALCFNCYKKFKLKVFPDFKGDYGRCSICPGHPMFHKGEITKHVRYHYNNK